MVALSGEEKVALLLANLDAGTAADLMARLGPEVSGLLQKHMPRITGKLAAEGTLDQVIQEFEAMLRAGPAERGPGLKIAEGTESVKEHKPPPRKRKQDDLIRLAELENQEDAIAALGEVPPQRLAGALAGEQARTAALLLDHLEVPQAAQVLKLLPSEARREIAVQLGQSPSGNQDLVERVVRAVLRKSCAGTGVGGQAGAARYKKMADILRLLERQERQEVLTAIEENDPETAVRIKQGLYLFEDIAVIADRSLQKLLAEIDVKTLALALKKADEPIREKVLNNLSKRARETLGEEMEFLGAVPDAQIQQAQTTVLEAMQRVDAAGELVMENS